MGGRIWYKGTQRADDSFDAHAEDYRFPLQDLSLSSPRSSLDSEFCFTFADIDRTTTPLGIPWELNKDTAFAFFALYIGLLWNIVALTVELSEGKKEKYQRAVETWRTKETHVLLEVQQLYGKLLHACLVVPAGRAYLTSLEAMLGICGNRPFMPFHSVKHLDEDLNWWSATLARPFVGRSIMQPQSLVDLHAFCDASTSVGVAITINGHWRAWTLRPGWQTLDGQRDIGWAECAGLELLILAIIQESIDSSHRHFRIYCDNRGIVDGWRNGRSRNRETNSIFRRIHARLAALNDEFSFHPRYVPSRDNPADGPSRGIFPPSRFLLPPVTLPDALSKFLVDAVIDSHPISICTPSQQPPDIELVDETPAQSFGDELFRYRTAWSEKT